MIQPLLDLGGTSLVWVQRGKRRRAYDLKSGENTFATLEWNRASGSLATGACTNGTFTFKRAGFLQPYVTVRQAPSRTDLAKLHMGFGWSGVLTFADLRRYDFLRYSFWRPEWAFVDMNGQVVCRFPQTDQLLKGESQVILEADPRRSPDLVLLAILGWYVILLQLDELDRSAMTPNDAPSG